MKKQTADAIGATQQISIANLNYLAELCHSIHRGLHGEVPREAELFLRLHTLLCRLYDFQSHRIESIEFNPAYLKSLQQDEKDDKLQQKLEKLFADFLFTVLLYADWRKLPIGESLHIFLRQESLKLACYEGDFPE